MSDNPTRVGRALGLAMKKLVDRGAFDSSGSGGRRGGGGGGDGIRKGPKRCYHCRSEKHLSRDCPRKDKSWILKVEQAAQQALQEVPPPQEARPAPAAAPLNAAPDVTPGVTAPAAPAAPAVVPAPPAPAQTLTLGPIIREIFPAHGPQFPPPPARECLLDRPLMVPGWSIHWSPVWARWYYCKFSDGTYSWERPE